MRIYIYPRNIREREKGSERERIFCFGLGGACSSITFKSYQHCALVKLTFSCILFNYG